MSDPRALEVGDTVGVVGAGTMGSGIAWVAAEAGHSVLLYDVDDTAVGAAIGDISTRLDRSVAKGNRSREEADATIGRIKPVEALDALSPAALVVEAIAERLDVKQALFTSLEDVVRTETILATNTSSLSVTAVAGHLRHPERVVGLHFFNPAPVMPLVEVVIGAATHDDTVDRAVATALAWGKTPVRCSSTPGFIVNRVARPFYSESIRLLAEGIADVATIDAIVTGAGGFRMGPFSLMDLVGLDVNLAVTNSVYEQTAHDPRFAPNVRQQTLVDAGHLGRKSGTGWYDYRDEPRRPEPLPVTERPRHCAIPNDPRLAGLVRRLEARNVPVETGSHVQYFATDGIRLMRTDGRSAALVNVDRPDPPVVLYDLVGDWETAGAIAITSPRWASEEHVRSAAAPFHAAGLDVYHVADVPGMVLMRIVAQLVSVAADAAAEGVAVPEDIDTAMKLGTNYPLGPFEWVDRITVAGVVGVLDHLRWFYGEDRYRTAGALRRSMLDDVHPRRLLGRSA